MIDVETFIERVMDAYTYEQFLEILVDDERLFEEVLHAFPDITGE